jgi:hypothetical protein
VILALDPVSEFICYLLLLHYVCKQVELFIENGFPVWPSSSLISKKLIVSDNPNTPGCQNDYLHAERPIQLFFHINN